MNRCYICKEIKETIVVTIPDGDKDMCKDCLQEYEKRNKKAFEGE